MSMQIQPYNGGSIAGTVSAILSVGNTILDSLDIEKASKRAKRLREVADQVKGALSFVSKKRGSIRGNSTEAVGPPIGIGSVVPDVHGNVNGKERSMSLYVYGSPVPKHYRRPQNMYHTLEDTTMCSTFTCSSAIYGAFDVREWPLYYTPFSWGNVANQSVLYGLRDCYVSHTNRGSIPYLSASISDTNSVSTGLSQTGPSLSLTAYSSYGLMKTVDEWIFNNPALFAQYFEVTIVALKNQLDIDGGLGLASFLTDFEDGLSYDRVSQSIAGYNKYSAGAVPATAPAPISVAPFGAPFVGSSTILDVKLNSSKKCNEKWKIISQKNFLLDAGATMNMSIINGFREIKANKANEFLNLKGVSFNVVIRARGVMGNVSAVGPAIWTQPAAYTLQLSQVIRLKASTLRPNLLRYHEQILGSQSLTGVTIREQDEDGDIQTTVNAGSVVFQ